MARRKKPTRRKTPATPRPTTPPTARRERAATTPLQKLLLVVFGLAVGVVALLLLEGALALLGVGERHRYEDPFVGFEPGSDLFTLETRPGGDVYVTSPNKLAFFNLQEFPAEKAPGTYRVFALGGSTTAGRPYDDQVAFARWMELYLEAMDPSRRFEVINAGAISYASYRIVVLMQELVRHEPDLFVIYTGHNEFLEERSYPDLVHENPRRRRLRSTLDRLRVVTLAREGLRRLTRDDERDDDSEVPRTLLASEVETRLEGWTGLDAYRRDDALRRSVIEHFGFNLRQMTRIARDHGVDVVFVRPISNLKDFSPFKSEPGAPVDESADAQFRLGRNLFERGDFAEARRAFIRAKDLDVAPLRALEPISARVAEVAAESGAALVDLPAILEDDSERLHGHRILGNEYLLDHVHPDIPVHGLIAERVIDVLVERGVARPAPSWSEARRREIFERVVGAIDRRYYAYRDLNLAKVLGWAGKLEEAEAPLLRAAETLGDEPDLYLNLGVLYQRTGRLEAALEALRRAVEMAPALPEAHFNLGVAHGLLGETEAGIAAFEEALRLRPDYPEARYDLAVLRRRQGDLDAALAGLREVLRERPDAVEVHREIGLVHRRRGRLDDAVAAFRRALEIAPDDAAARVDLGVTLGRLGRLDDAVAELERAIALAPDAADAHYNLGVVLARAGRVDDAVAAYRRAVEADPAAAEARNNLGILLAGRGELEAARRELERAVELAPGYAEAQLNLGVVLDQLGRPDAALAAVERAIALEPDNARFREARALLVSARRGGGP